MPSDVTPRAQIEQEARDAAAAGRTPNEACRWPFGTPQAEHWLATYLLAPNVLEHTATAQQPPEVQA